MSGYQQSSMQNYSGYTTVNAEGQAGSFASTQPTFQSRSLSQSGSGSVTQGALYGSGGRVSSPGYVQGGSYTVGSPVNQVVTGSAMQAVTGSPTGYSTGYAMQGPTSPVSPLPPIPNPASIVLARLLLPYGVH